VFFVEQKFKDTLLKNDSEQKRLKRERADLVLMMEKFMSESLQMGKEHLDLVPVINNVGYMVGMLLEL